MLISRANDVFLSLLCLFALLMILPKLFTKNYPIFIWVISLYIFLILAQVVFGCYYDLTRRDLGGKKSPTAISVFIFIILEYSIFSFLLSKFISPMLIKKWLRTSIVLFIITALLVWNSIPSYSKVISILTVLESILLIPLCLYHLYELLNKPRLLKITNESSFWITMGILFLFISMTPYYLFFEYFENNLKMRMIDYVSYDILVIIFTRASLLTIKLAHNSDFANLIRS